MCSCISTILKLVKVIISDPVKNHLKIYFCIFNSDVSFLILIAFFNGLTRNFSNFTMYLMRTSQRCSLYHNFFQMHRITDLFFCMVKKLQLSFNMKFMTHFLPVSFFFFKRKLLTMALAPLYSAYVYILNVTFHSYLFLNII